MTSQKRYRQHQESNMSNARFRDLPPRFKRQKSQSSVMPTPVAVPVTAVEQSPSPTTSPVTVRPEQARLVISPQVPISPSNIYAHDETLASGHMRSRLDAQQAPPIAVSQAATWQWSHKNSTSGPAVMAPSQKIDIPSSPVLAPWDSRQFNQALNTQSQPVSLGTHFGYNPPSPPLSPWAAKGSSNYGQRSVLEPTPWLPSQDSLNSMATSPGFFNNENWAPVNKLSASYSPDLGWNKPPSPSCRQYGTAASQQAQGPTSPSHKPVYARGREDVKTNQKQVLDYTDPDIRTIEMLRELERVADEKEKEIDELGVDRKSLVSHHLRMLMCAVDRYTEGIEDELDMSSRHDEVAASSDSCRSSPAASPGLSELQHQKEAREEMTGMKSASDSFLWSADYKTSVWKEADIKQLSPSLSNSCLSLGSPFPQAQLQSAASWQAPNALSNRNNTWNLWSSPSFDFSRVLTSSNLEDLTQNPFGRFKENDERDRKPLYQR